MNESSKDAKKADEITDQGAGSAIAEVYKLLAELAETKDRIVELEEELYETRGKLVVLAAHTNDPRPIERAIAWAQRRRGASDKAAPAATVSPELAQALLDAAAPDRTNNEGAEEWRRDEAQKRVDAAQVQAKTPASNAAPPAESEREQAKRYARMYLDAAGCEQDADEGTIDAMLPIVREARASEAAWREQASANAHGAEQRRAFQEAAEHERDEALAELDKARAMLASLGAYTDDSKPLAEVIAWMHGDMAQRLKVATEARAMLTEDEARRWAENVIRDWRINSGVLSDLLLWANRGEIPLEVKDAPTGSPREVRFVSKVSEPLSGGYPGLLARLRALCPSLSEHETKRIAYHLWVSPLNFAAMDSYYTAVRAVFPDAKIFDSDGNEFQ